MYVAQKQVQEGGHGAERPWSARTRYICSQQPTRKSKGFGGAERLLKGLQVQKEAPR